MRVPSRNAYPRARGAAARSSKTPSPLWPPADAWAKLDATRTQLSKSAPPGTVRLLDLLVSVGRDLKGPEPEPTDGLACCARALAELSQPPLGRPKRKVVVFDLDNTGFETRERTCQILQAYDALHGTQHFREMTWRDMGLSAEHTISLHPALTRLSDAEKQQIQAHWLAAFWNGESFLKDLVIDPIRELAWAAKAAGATVVYLTGRVDKQATLRQLQAAGFPDAKGKNIFSKPNVRTKTAQFKGKLLRSWLRRGDYVGWFITESCRDIEAVSKIAKKVRCIRLPFPYARPDSSMAGVPVLPQDWSFQVSPILTS